MFLQKGARVRELFSEEALFAAIDSRDAAGFAALLHEAAVFQFGNAPPVQGREAIRAAVAGFFESVAAVQHKLLAVWRPPDALICHGSVTYTRHDCSKLTVPFANVLVLEEGLARDYRIFVDISTL